MIADARHRLEKVPFVPFVIRTSNGCGYSVPTVDHAFITPRGNRIAVVADDGATNVLGPLHINAAVDLPNGK
jgi:hypothetical protein